MLDKKRFPTHLQWSRLHFLLMFPMGEVQSKSTSLWKEAQGLNNCRKQEMELTWCCYSSWNRDRLYMQNCIGFIFLCKCLLIWLWQDIFLRLWSVLVDPEELSAKKKWATWKRKTGKEKIDSSVFTSKIISWYFWVHINPFWCFKG